MAKSIKLTKTEWAIIRKKLKQEYDWKPSVLAIRDVMRRELGFTTRYHKDWDADHGRVIEFIYLDFFDDTKETFFRLKYL